MEDKRYDPYTGYEIKDEDSTQEYHTQDDDSYRRYRYEDDHIEQPQQEQTSGIAIATMILGIIAVVCMVIAISKFNMHPYAWSVVVARQSRSSLGLQRSFVLR